MHINLAVRQVNGSVPELQVAWLRWSPPLYRERLSLKPKEKAESERSRRIFCLFLVSGVWGFETGSCVVQSDLAPTTGEVADPPASTTQVLK